MIAIKIQGEFKHTPGPWTLQRCDDGMDPTMHKIVAGRFNAILANIYLPAEMEQWDTETPAQRRANACLMAAAPEMLEALEALLKESVAISKHICNDYYVPYVPSIAEDNAEKTIKKARGDLDFPENEKFDTFMKDSIICPYCGFKDYWTDFVEFNSVKEADIECADCGKAMNVRMTISVDYTTMKTGDR